MYTVQFKQVVKKNGLTGNYKDTMFLFKKKKKKVAES